MASHSPYGPGWLFTPDFSKELTIENEQAFFESPDVFKAILESIQDGVSVLDRELNIRYMNASLRHIYKEKTLFPGRKCYEFYHSRSTPCEDCPSLIAAESKKPETSVVRYDHQNNESNWHQLFSIPVLNTHDEVILIIEYIRDITFQNSMIQNLNELAQRFEALEKQNEILADILQQSEQNRDALEQTISTNVERFVRPSLEYLKKTVRAEDVDFVNGLISEIVFPITKKRDSAMSGLTPRELQVAVLVKEGDTSKEIAAKLCVTQKAVDYHRLNIRRKLRLPRETSLHTYLETHL